jgi:hypothetical protein
MSSVLALLPNSFPDQPENHRVGILATEMKSIRTPTVLLFLLRGLKIQIWRHSHQNSVAVIMLSFDFAAGVVA